MSAAVFVFPTSICRADLGDLQPVGADMHRSEAEGTFAEGEPEGRGVAL